MKTNGALIAMGIALALLLGAFIGLMIASNDEPVKVPTAEEIAALVKVPAAVPTMADANLSNKVDALDAKISSLNEFEDEADEKLQNDTAKALVLKELSTRDFKEKVVEVLNDEGYSIEDYKNVSVYYSKINDVDLGDETAEVKVTIKVASFNDGDEEDSFKVKLTALFNVEGLDVDDIEDAELDDDYELVFVSEYD